MIHQLQMQTIKSNKVINEILSNTKYSILSEEDVDDQSRLSKNMIWIVDPLDGTSDFIDKTGEFTVMIALIQKQKTNFRSYCMANRKNIICCTKELWCF